LTLALGANPEGEFCGRGRIKVVRKGRYHPVYLLKLNGSDLAQLEWHGPRRVRYTNVASGEHFDMKIGPMKRKIRSVDGDGKLAKLIVSSNRNLSRRDLRAQMPNGDNFIVRRKTVDRWGSCRLEVRKQHYLNSVLVFHFDGKDLNAPILVDIERLMKWEIAHFHRLLALVTARIGLERRMNGSC
jgi:hypothetical protein